MAATTEKSSVPRGEKLCVINGPIKGHHVYQTDYPVGTRFQCFKDSRNRHSDTAVVVKKADSIVGHVPEGLCHNVSLSSAFLGLSRPFLLTVSPLVCLVGLPRALGLLVVG